MNLILGIDPGISGGAAILSEDRTYIQHVIFKKLNSIQLSNWMFGHAADIRLAFLEGVGAFPGQGVVSTFKFGMNYGWWQGVLAAYGIPFAKVYPLKWQTAMQCRTGGNKNVSKDLAKKLFPSLKITHANADALLIAEYGRRLYSTKS